MAIFSFFFYPIVVSKLFRIALPDGLSINLEMSWFLVDLKLVIPFNTVIALVYISPMSTSLGSCSFMNPPDTVSATRVNLVCSTLGFVYFHWNNTFVIVFNYNFLRVISDNILSIFLELFFDEFFIFLIILDKSVCDLF